MKLDASDLPELRPLIAAIVSETIDQRQAVEAQLGDRLAYSEAEAAALLGLKQHQLRDARLRGEIDVRRIGSGYRYSRSQLLAFVEGK